MCTMMIYFSLLLFYVPTFNYEFTFLYILQKANLFWLNLPSAYEVTERWLHFGAFKSCF